VSIARRLQDPLAELVKIEPKAIGVGQYQHDVNPHRMAKALDSRVEDCVNAVGVLVNSASAPLLARVSGLSTTVADNIIRYRDEHGRYTAVPRIGKRNGAGPARPNGRLTELLYPDRPLRLAAGEGPSRDDRRPPVEHRPPRPHPEEP